MYKSFTVRNFRCFKDLTVRPLERVNLIAGKNNVGKTALIEALWLHHGYHNPELGARLSVFRGITRWKSDEFMWDLFSGFDPTKKIELSSITQDGVERTLNITIHEHPTSRVSRRKEGLSNGNGKESLAADMLDKETTAPVESEVRMEFTGGIEAHAFVEADDIRFERPPGVKEPSAIFLGARVRDNLETLAQRLGNLVADKSEGRIVEVMKVVEPRLDDLVVRYGGGVPVIHGDIGSTRRIPLPLMGDGMGRLLGIALAIPEAQNGALLVDEVENGLHYSIMEDVWKAIHKLADEYNVQIFATTHSLECIRAAFHAFSKEEQEIFALHRLERVKDKIRAVTYDQDKLEAALEIDVEVR